jgi:hypothetical protein
MSPNNIIKFLLFLLSTTTFLVNGMFMIKEKDVLNFKNLNKEQDIYVALLIFTEIYIGIILIYNLLYYIYEHFYSCCNDNKLTSSFSLLKTIFLLSGIASHIVIIYYLIKNKNYIDENINNINIIYTSNICACFFIILIINLYKNCVNKNKEHLIIK